MSLVEAGLVTLTIVVGVVILIAALEALRVKRMRAFKERIREIRDRAKREMRAAKDDPEKLDEILTRAKDEIEDLEL